jgi:outer membrane protein assembly factor BamA
MRHLDRGEVFLKGQRVTTPQTLIVPLPFSNDDLLAFSRLKPNRKILGIRLNHGVYLMVNKEKLERDKLITAEKCKKKNEQRRVKGKEEEPCRCWREFWAYTVGEPSATLDTVKMRRSAEQMILHMQKRGYFDAQVIPSVNYINDSASCVVDYHLISGDPYVINRLQFEINDPWILPLKKYVEEAGAIKIGMPLEVDVLNAARDKVTQLLNNEGFFDFTRDYIRFEVDTNSGRRDVGVIMQISEPEFADDQGNTFSTSHRKYYIGDVFVHTQFDGTDPNYQPNDTTLFDNFNILSKTRSEINPELVSCLMAFGSDDIYQKKHIETTYKRFSKLGVFRSTSIKLIPRETKSADGRFLLDTHIQLTPARRQMFTIDPHMTNRSGNLGIYGNLQYTHKNVFRGAESLELRVD